MLVGGLPGTGKSTLAAALVAETGWDLLRSDELRRELQPSADGGAPATDTGRYEPAAVGAVYDELLVRARRHLDEGEAVVLDASWIDAGRRAEAVRVAADTGSELVELRCTCEEPVATARINERSRGRDDVSEATPHVRSVMAARMDPWPSAITIDTSRRSAAECASWALREIAP